MKVSAINFFPYHTVHTYWVLIVMITLVYLHVGDLSTGNFIA